MAARDQAAARRPGRGVNAMVSALSHWMPADVLICAAVAAWAMLLSALLDSESDSPALRSLEELERRLDSFAFDPRQPERGADEP